MSKLNDLQKIEGASTGASKADTLKTVSTAPPNEVEPRYVHRSI